MTSRDKTIAEKLSTKGLEFSILLRDDNQKYFEDLPYSYFSIAAAIGFTWTKHAQYKEEFITYASGYIDGVTPLDATMATRFCARLSPENLGNALLNYRRYYKKVKDMMPDFYNCDVHDLARLQQKLLNRLDTLRKEGVTYGIGPWLFTGPFKIILTDQDRLWHQKGINAIVLPTGFEVDK